METLLKELVREKYSKRNSYTCGKPYTTSVKLFAYKPGDRTTIDSSKETLEYGRCYSGCYDVEAKHVLV